jgi:hypothetical protein
MSADAHASTAHASAMPAAAHTSAPHASAMPAATTTTATAACERRRAKRKRRGKRTRDEATKNPVVHPESSVVELPRRSRRERKTTSRANGSRDFK